MAADGWRNLPEGNATPPPDSITIFQPQISVTRENEHQVGRKRSGRRSFSAYSFSVPKTRRQKKLAKTMPLSQMPRSPLSAITERSGTNTSAASPAIDLSELPTEATPPRGPDTEESEAIVRPTSTAWPLPVENVLSRDMLQPVQRNSSAATYIDESGSLMPPPRSELGSRSASIGSKVSDAPDEPLPPLPTFVANNRWPRRRESKIRYSNGSSDTVATSVLTSSNIPRRNVSSPISKEPSSPTVNIHQIGLQKYDSERKQWEPSTLSLGSPAGKTTMHSTRRVHAGLGSTHGSIVTSSLLHTKRPSNARSQAQSSQPADLARSQAVADSHWLQPDPFRYTPDMPNSGQSDNMNSPGQRHSMFETPSIVALSPSSSPGGSPSFSKPKRPLSLGAAPSLSQDDDRALSTRSSVSSIGSSSESHQKGHKRQNCVRISNLPIADGGRKPIKFGLPLMAEEEEQNINTGSVSAESSAERLLHIPGLDLINREIERGQKKFGPTLSPFDNRLILEPTSKQRLAAYENPATVPGITSSHGEPDIPDTANFAISDIRERQRKAHRPNASKTPVEGEKPTTEKSQPLSISRRQRAIVDAPATPKSVVKALKNETYEQDSPTLPSPTISSASLFTRRLQSRKYLKTSAGGPNGPRAQALAPESSDSPPSSRPVSPSPASAHAKLFHLGLANESSGQDFRKSAMMLKGMNSDLREHRELGNSYRSDRDMGDTDTIMTSPSVANFSLNPTPTKAEFSDEIKGSAIQTLANIRMQMKSPSTADLPSYLNYEDRRGTYLRPDDSRGSLNPNRSKYTMRSLGISPSVMSIGGQSDMWEDASVKSDEDQQVQAIAAPQALYSNQQNITDNGFESFAGACEVVETRPVTKTPTKTPTKASARIARGNLNPILDTGYESFAGACEVVDSRPPPKTPTKISSTRPRGKENFVIDSGFESFAGACEVVDTRPMTRTPVKTPKDRKRQGGLMLSPERDDKSREYGLGLMNMGPSAFATPASLYDREGFLKE